MLSQQLSISSLSWVITRMYCTVFAFFRQFGIQQQLLRHTRHKKLR